MPSSDPFPVEIVRDPLPVEEGGYRPGARFPMTAIWRTSLGLSFQPGTVFRVRGRLKVYNGKQLKPYEGGL
jgi:hypothetical protein